MTSREINNLVRDVFASLRDAVFVIDAHSRTIVECNPSTERIFGYRRDEIIGRTMEFLYKEGRLAGSEQSVSQVLDDGGECVAIVVVVSDIMDRKSTEDALERDRAELKAIYELAPVLLCTLDADRRVLHANKAFTEFTGVPESELLEGRACGVFGCINARDDPRGCGFGPKCQDCQLRLAIEDTQKTGREHRDVEYRATLEHDGARRDVVLLGSTVRVVAAGHPNLLLCLQDITLRVQAEDALRLQASILSNMAEGIFLIGLADGVIKYANERFETMFGYAPGELIGKDVAIVNAPTDKTPEETKREIVEILKATGEWHGQIENIKKDGTHFWCRANVSLFDHPEFGRVIVSVHSDITERKRVEEELKKSIQLLRDTGEMAKVGGWELDLSTKEVLWTEEVRRIHNVEPGYKPKLEEAMNFYAPESKPALEVVLKKAMETGEPYDIESLFIPSGSKDKIWVRSLGKAVYSGDKIVKLVGTFQNIDKYMRIREALRESEEEFRMLFETMVNGVVYQNAEGHIISANHAAEQILGLTLDQMLGRKSQDPRWRAIHEDGSDFPGDTHPAMVALRTGKEVRNVIMGVSRLSNNEYVWININAIPQFKPGNTKPYQVYATFEDITERKMAETALAQSEQKLKNSHVKLRSLAEHLLHAREQERRNIAQEIHDELGQVLTALKMDLRWLEKRLEPSQQRFQQKLSEMIGLTDQTIEKVQRLSSQLRPRMLDDLGLAAAIEWLGADFSRRTRIRCKVTVELTESRIGGNSTTVIFRMVQEALINVERHAKASAVVVELREVQERIEIRVQDNGVGITEKQAEGPKSFGLIGIRERAQGLDGEVSIRGEPGKGTTVAISIPYPGGGALA